MEIYQDGGGGGAAAVASAPITPSRRRRGLGSSSRIGSIQPQKPQQHKASRHEHDDADDSNSTARRRKSTALTPKKPSDMNKRRRRKSLQEKKGAMALGGGGVDKAATATATENTSSSPFIGTSTTKTAPLPGSSSSSSRSSTAGNGSRFKVQTPESKIAKPKVSLSRLGLSPRSTAEAPKSFLSSSDAAAASKSRRCLSTTTTNIVKTTNRVAGVDDMGGKAGIATASEPLPSETAALPSTAPTNHSSKTTTRRPTEDNKTRAGRSAKEKKEDTGGSSSTGTKPSTPSSRSSSDLRKFIQQRRKEIRSSAEKDTGGDIIVGADVGTAAASAKTVRFKSDVIAKEEKSRAKGECGGTGGGTLMDLADEFRQEVPSTGTTGTTSSTKPKEAAAAPEVSLTSPAPTTKKLPVLSLGKFQESLWLDFGDEHRNVVGKTRSMSFLLESPQTSESKSSSSGSTPGYCSVEFERVPFKKGFNLIVEDDASPFAAGGAVLAGARNGGVDDAGSRLVFGNNSADDDSTTAGSDRSSPTVLCIKNGDRKRLRLTWTPTDAGGIREAVHLKLPRGRIRITAHGKARAIENNVKKSKKRATKTASDKENYVKGSLHSSSEPSTPHQSVPKRGVRFVASTPAPDFSTPKTVYSKSSPGGNITSASSARAQITYDSEWADKQCDAFAKWLNYCFSPTEDIAHELSLQNGGDGVNSSSLTRAGLRTLLLHRRRAQGRKRAAELYQTDEMVQIQCAIEAEVASGKLSIRSDRDVFADVGLRGQIISLLMSYATPWLRLGLETIFGEILSEDISASGSDGAVLRPRAMLKRFIVERVLSDPVLSKKYTGRRHATGSKTLSGRFDKEYKKAMRQHSLRCILLLVAFLDRAKMENVLETVPCLFTRKGEVKSSRDVITAVCRDLLFKEGNIFKHLSRIGLTFEYKQAPIDEYNYAVENLAVDLRDGVRLARMAEILTNDTSSCLVQQMRLPTISRLQKLHNTEVALSALIEAGVPNLQDIATHHIVDGHRPRVLKLLWSTIAHFQLPSLLNLDLLREEIENVHRANKSRRVLSMRYIGGGSNSNTAGLDVEEVDKLSLQNGAEAEIGTLLLQWCQAVCSCFGLSVKNFTTSFADGKVLCYLLHYYHPGMLRRSEILSTTRDLPQDSDALRRRNGEGYEQALSNERKNSTLASKRMSELGGVPGMLPITSSSDIPEEKSTLLCLAYLCSRLMESSKEILATIAIQNCYRRYQERILLEKKRAAANIIFQHWQNNKAAYFASQRRRFGPAVGVIEQFIFHNRDKLVVLRARREREETQTQAAISLQATVRRWIAVHKFQRARVEHFAAIQLQSICRGALQRSRYTNLQASQHCMREKMQNGAIVIQSVVRGRMARSDYERARFSAIQIQSLWRGFVTALQFQCSILDVTIVQKWARRRAAMRKAEQRRSAVLCLQSLVRMRLAVRRFQSIQSQYKAATAIQRLFRSHKARQTTELMRTSATTIQASWRCYQAELRYMDTLMDIIFIQCFARRFLARVEISQKRSSVLQMQQAVRMWLSRRRLEDLRKDRDAMERMEAAAIVCQRLVRRVVAIKRFQQIQLEHRVTNEAATNIQALYRGFNSRQEIANQHGSATMIQCYWRRFTSELKYQITLMDIVLVQSYARRFLAKLESSRRIDATVKLQCAARKGTAMRRIRARKTVRSEVDRFVGAVIVCQSVVRRRIARKRVDRKRSKVSMLNSSALRIQTAWRRCSAKIMYQEMQRSEEERAFRRQCEESSIVIQRMARGHAARTAVKMNLAARQIQKMWRGYVQNIEFMVSILSAIAIQAHARSMIQRRWYQSTRNALVAFQASVRGSNTRFLIQRRNAAGIRIQSWYRGRAAIDKYERHVEAAIVLQSSARGWFVRREVDLLHCAACEIQRVWRGHQANVDYIMMVLAAIQIQSLARMVAARKLLNIFNEQKLRAEAERRGRIAAARVIQRYYRRFYMERILHEKATVLQRSARGFLARARLVKMMTVVFYVQRAYRGRVVRLARSRMALVVARRIEKANRNAELEPQMKLGVRTSSALDILQTSKRLSEIIRAIKTLEVSTRLSEKCCRAFAAADAPEILYALIRTCNRSLPHIELLHYVLLTLSNVARYSYLMPSVATDDSLEVLMDLTQMFRDKENIFCLSIALLERVVFSNERHMDMCRSAENAKRLKGIHSLCKRRQKMARGAPQAGPPSPSAIKYDLRRGIRSLERILRNELALNSCNLR